MEFYNDNYVCKYMLNGTTEEYQKDLLNILDISFNIDEFEYITKKVTKIFNHVNGEEFKDVYECCRNNNIFLNDSDDDMCFIFLFGYDTLFIMHKLLCYYKKNNKINNDIKKELIDKISET